MYEAIQNFAQQFTYEPEIKNKENFSPASKYIIAGMGGSNLVADLIRIRDPFINIIIHKTYRLPSLSTKDLKNSLVITSSYSGNTEEVLDAFDTAIEKKLNIVAISTGGKLIDRAQKNNKPHIILPSSGIQPRSALGFNIIAILTLMKRTDLLEELKKLTNTLNPSEFEKNGKELAEKLQNRVPIIYSSLRNKGIAYNWKIKFNETGKIPAFYNVLPELNHNEMTGYDVQDSSRSLSKNFNFIFLTDPNDNPRIQERMSILAKMYADRGLPVTLVPISEPSDFKSIFSSLLTADWAALHTAKLYKLESEQVPMVEEFKKLLNS